MLFRVLQISVLGLTCLGTLPATSNSISTSSQTNYFRGSVVVPNDFYVLTEFEMYATFTGSKWVRFIVRQEDPSCGSSYSCYSSVLDKVTRCRFMGMNLLTALLSRLST